MAFNLPANNLGGVAVITDTNSIPRQTPENFALQYDYLSKNTPELIPELVYAQGKGSILGFMRATQNGERKFESDIVQHGEINRLHKNFTATVTGNNFTTTVAHGLEPRMVILIAQPDGTQFQGIVATTPTATTFTAFSDTVAFTFAAATVNIIADFSSRFKKGDTSFSKSREFVPVVKQFFPQIIKTYQDISDSNLAQSTWIMPRSGSPIWWNEEVERISTLHDNKVELTSIFHKRALDTAPSVVTGQFSPGMNGVVPIVENGGNVSNEPISIIADLSALSKRAKRNSICREFTIWCGHDQIALIRQMMAGVNSAFVNGSSYGAFQNKKDMALSLDFVSAFIDGVQFHFASWALLDDPTLLAAVNFEAQAISYLMVPSGNAYVTENGNTITKPYLEFMYRANGLVNRRRQMKWFGVLGTQVLEDKSGMEILTEATVRVASANSFFVGRKTAAYYPV